ncbi:TonB-dependent receptor [Elongatibacter sediminis]|uniref:TonB-dependent receptor n=1 Tax=Elongatibacter sediminis TaxID=3119006 RepID=A0AAW9R6R3_9GAMM
MQRQILTSSIAIALGAFGLWHGEARAQSGQQAAGAIEEIIVTARRREESLQDVPGTVTALSSETLERAGVQRADDFISLTPGVSMVDAAEVGDTQVNIRGINGARDAENSFAFILDGVLYTNPAAFNREYTNLRQIEVFKGPQGAIYGRNAAAGAIIVTTTTPGNERESNATLSVAGDSTYLAKASFSGPLIEDELYFRLSADWRDSDGYYRNQFQDGAAIVDTYEGWNVHGRLVWEASDTLTIDSKVRVGSVNASSITFNSTFALPVFAAGLNNPQAYQDVNDFDFQFDANIVSDNDQDAFEFSTKIDQQLDGMSLTGWFLYSDIENDLMSDGTSAAFGFYNSDPMCQQTVAELTGYPLLPPQFIGNSPVGVIFDPVNGSFLGAYTPTTCDGIQEQLRNQKDLSVELRLASDTDARLQWMIGAYYLDIDRQVGVSLNRDSGALPIRGLFQPEPGPNSTASLVHDQFDSEVFALFGQLQYDVTDTVELALALRYDNEKRKVSSLVPFDARQSFIDLNFDGVFNDPVNPALSSLINPDGIIPDQSETFSELQPKLSARWDVTESTSIFGSYGVGFKAGGFNNSGSAATVNIFINGFINCGNPLGICFADQLGVTLPVISDEYDKETSDAFELGFNSVVAGGQLRLSGAAYYTEVTDMQFFEFFVGTFGLLRVVSNIDKVEITGLELAADWAPTENWRFYAGANWLDSEIKQSTTRPDTVGNEAPYTPEYTINLAADMNYPITDSLNLIARADARFVGKTWFHTVQEGQRPTIFMPLFELGFGPGAGGLGIAEYDVARRDEFAIVDLRVGIGGDNWSVTGFVTNLTDEHYLEEVIPAPEFGGNFDHPGAERRYGVEFSIRY